MQTPRVTAQHLPLFDRCMERLSRAKGWGSGIALGLVALLAMPFVAHSVIRGLSVGSDVEVTTSRFISADWTATWAIYGHMVAGGLLTALAFGQLSGALRRRWPRVHHINGYWVGMLSFLTGALGLIYIARQGTIGGPVMSLGFALYGILLVLAAAQTIRFARLRDPRHSTWAGRLVILAIGSWLFRVQYGLWDLSFGDLGRTEGFRGGFDQVMAFGFYLPWLALHELLRSGRKTI